MSFCFNPLGTNPMQTMHSLMENVTNPNTYLTALPQLTGVIPQMSPLNNNQLEFNMNKTTEPGAGPMDLETIAGRDLELIPNFESGATIEDVRKSVETKISESLLEPLNDKTAMVTPNNDVIFNNMISMQPSFMMMPSMMNLMDPATIMNVQQYSMLGPLGSLQPQPPLTPSSACSMGASLASVLQETNILTGANIFPVPGIINCEGCTLFPPKSGLAGYSKAEKPPGCRTVFVGGLPPTITEEMIREIFERCGEITTLRLSKKNFCHIRFGFEASVTLAIYLSGYRIRMTNATDSSHCGTVIVDYAQARDDLYEWECKQRKLQREVRHRERIEKDRMRPQSPPLIVHYTELEASSVAEKIKSDETFSKAVHILIAWLERGDCSKRNANTFYSMIQTTNSHLRRLANDKNVIADELKKAKAHHRTQLQIMMSQFTQIEKVFNAASHKKVWDHFSKAQRKNIDLWKKQSLELRSSESNDDERDDDEMDMSDDDREAVRQANKKIKLSPDKNQSSDSYKSFPDNSKSDSDNEIDYKNQQIKVLQETIRNLQTQLLDNKTKEKENLLKITNLESKLKESNVKQLLLKTKIATAKASSSKSSEIDETETSDTMSDKMATSSYKLRKITVDYHNNFNRQISCSPTQSVPMPKFLLDQFDAKLISLISTYLVIHPFGTTYDSIWTYTSRAVPNLRPKDFDDILNRYSNIFMEETYTTEKPKNERNWKFCGFNLATSLAKVISKDTSKNTTNTHSTNAPNSSSKIIDTESLYSPYVK